MAYTTVELNDLNTGSENGRNDSALEDQRHKADTKSTVLVHLLTNLIRIFRRHAIPIVEPPLDDLEQLLEDADEVSTAGVGASLRKDYVLFKGVSGPELIKSLVLFKCFAPPVAGNDSDEEPNVFDPSGTFSECLSQFRTFLGFQHSECLQLCVLAAESPLAKTTLLSSQSLSTTLLGSVKDRTQSPKQAVVLVLGQCWLLPKSVKSDLMKTESAVQLKWLTKLPSKDGFNHTQNIFQPFEAKFTFYWQLEVPKYISDLDIYVWQRYSKPPKSQHAYVVRPSLAGQGQRLQRLIIRLDSTEQIAKFEKQRCLILAWDSSTETSRPRSVLDELCLSILAVFHLIIGDTSKFLEGLNEQLDYLYFEGRSNPSASKIEYLLHVDDCRRESIKGLKDASALLKNLQTSLGEPAPGYTGWQASAELLLQVNELSADLVYLTDELISTGNRIKEMRKTINEKLGLKQIRRSTILAFLAALYIPLAFASSIFSMNIADPNLDGALGDITNTIRDANARNPFTLTNQTGLLANVISASGGLTYSWYPFIGLAVALVAGSFILPIIMGPILRLALQSIVEYRAYGRLVYPKMLALWVFLAYIMLPIMLPSMGFEAWYYQVFPVQLSFQLLLPTLVFFSIFQGRGPFRWFKGPQGKRSVASIGRRLCFIGICVTCAIYSTPKSALKSPPDFVPDFTYDPSIILVGWIPLLILLWVFAGRSVRRWLVRTWSKTQS